VIKCHRKATLTRIIQIEQNAKKNPDLIPLSSKLVYSRKFEIEWDRNKVPTNPVKKYKDARRSGGAFTIQGERAEMKLPANI